MPLYRRITVAYPAIDRPTPRQVAGGIAAGLRSYGIYIVDCDEAGVAFSKVPWDLGTWHPFAATTSGSVRISPSPEGFSLDIYLGVGGVVLGLTAAVLMGLLFGVIANDLALVPWAVLWLGIAGGGGALRSVAWRAPHAIAALAASPLPPQLPSERTAQNDGAAAV